MRWFVTGAVVAVSEEVPVLVQFLLPFLFLSFLSLFFLVFFLLVVWL